jgi:hypothetical protein
MGRLAENQAVHRRGWIERHAPGASQSQKNVQHRSMQVRMKKSPSAKTGLNLFS